MLKVTARTSRIAAQLQRSLATLLRRGVKDPRVGNVTITAVEVASDLSYARINVLPFAAAAQPNTQIGKQDGKDPAKELLAGLRSASGYLRGELARELKLRHMPRLEFQLDVVIEGAHRLSNLIESAVKSDRERGAPDVADGDGDS